MNFQETDIYVLLKQGAYVYSAKSNKLDLVVAEDIRALGGTQAFITNAPVTLIYVAISPRWARKRDNKRTQPILMRLYLAECLSLLRLRRPGHRCERFGGPGDPWSKT